MESHDAEFREGGHRETLWCGDCGNTKMQCKCEKTQPTKAKVILFKPSGKYYTEEEWEIPTEEMLEVAQQHIPRGMRDWIHGPTCMRHSKDFRRIAGGAVLVESQEPWGFPHLFNADHTEGDD